MDMYIKDEDGMILRNIIDSIFEVDPHQEGNFLLQVKRNFQATYSSNTVR